MPPVRALAVPVLVAAGLLTAGCGQDGRDEGRARPPEAPVAGRPAPTSQEGRAVPDPAAERPATTAAGETSEAGPRTGSAAADARAVPPRRWTATCPTATKSPLGCRGVRARVVAVESVDPDGDGDLHVVAAGGDVTAPGLTVFDVRQSLRPRRDPREGEWVTGAGPVFRGSFGQRQIQVDVFRVWRPGR